MRRGAEFLFLHAKNRLSELGLVGPGKIRVNKAGCLGRCSNGPTVVVYPGGVWYACETITDVDKIIDRHLLNGQVVTECEMPIPEIKEVK